MASGPIIGTAYVQIVPTTKGISNNVSSLLGDEMSKAGDVGGKNLGTNLFKSFLASNVVMKITDLIMTGIQKAVSAGISFIKDALQLYGEYEQLAGGAMKIFDEIDYSKIYGDAKNAYKELNMSMNDYLSSINLVGAAFATTMGDERGYEVARQGMKAISDYATGTGKSVDLLNEKYQMITRSTSSYQSIADQFSGILPQTSADFLEAAQSAGFLSDSYTKLTEVPVDEYQQAVTEMLALGVDQLGLTDNTVKEATNTITGSIATFQAAWENLKTGLGDPNADIQELTNNVIESGKAMVENIIPVISQILDGVSDVIIEIAPIVQQELPGIVEKLRPTIESVLTQLIEIGTQILIDLAPALTEACNKILAAVINTIAENHPIIGAALRGMFALPLSTVDEAPKPFRGLAGNIMSDVQGIFTGGAQQTSIGVQQNFSDMVSGVTSSVGIMSANVTDESSAMSGTFLNDLSGLSLGSSSTFSAMATDASTQTSTMKTSVLDNMLGMQTGTSDYTNQMYLASSSNFSSMESDASTKASSINKSFADNLSKMMGTNSSGMDTINKKMSSAWSSADSDTSSRWSSISKSVGGRMLDVMNAVSTRTASMYSTLSSTFSRVTSTMVDPFSSAQSQISGQVSGIKGLLNFSWSIPKPRLPHINWHMSSVGGLLRIPVFDGVSWYAKGGIFDSPTIAGIGEAGPEAVVPLDKLWARIDRIADSVSERSEGDQIQIIVNAAPGMDVNALANAVQDRLVRLQKQRDKAWA